VIFVTVGSAQPFDRLIRAVDQWAGLRGRRDVFAQIGKSHFVPQHISAAPFFSPAEFRERVRSAHIVVAHAGMGSIISALEMGKRIIVVPRKEAFGETRSDHQEATARRFEERLAVIAARDEEDLISKLEGEDASLLTTSIGREASAVLISAIRSFIVGDQCNQVAVETPGFREQEGKELNGIFPHSR
jgi:UDP-N-acetylglucosamine transferase subunit ALG13